MLKKSKSVRLNGPFPAYFAIVMTPLGLIPLIGNLVANAIAVFIIILIISKQDKFKAFLKTAGISYAVALAGLGLAIYICLSCENKPEGYYSADNLLKMASKTEEEALAESALFVYIGFIISTIAIFIGHFFLTFSKWLCKEIHYKTWQRICFSLILTVLNAPYLVFVSNDFLVSLGYTQFYPTMM